MLITNPYECMGNLGMVITRRVCTYMILQAHGVGDEGDLGEFVP